MAAKYSIKYSWAFRLPSSFNYKEKKWTSLLYCCEIISLVYISNGRIFKRCEHSTELLYCIVNTATLSSEMELPIKYLSSRGGWFNFSIFIPLTKKPHNWSYLYVYLNYLNLEVEYLFMCFWPFVFLLRMFMIFVHSSVTWPSFSWFAKALHISITFFL